MNTFSPNLNDQWNTESRSALLRLAEDWTDLILNLETGPRAVPHTVSVQIVTSAARYFTHPLLGFEQVTQDMTALSACVSNLDRFINFGSWDDEDDDALSGRSEEERTEFLQREIDWYLFRLMRALDPCVQCCRDLPFAQWRSAGLRQIRCPEHVQAQREQRQAIIDHRPLHAGAIGERAFQLLSFKDAR